jgi:nitrite reductase/ring-hydroxylating ferredoxin subunit
MAASCSAEVGRRRFRWHAAATPVHGHNLMETSMAADGAKGDWVRVAAKGDVAEGQCLGVRVGATEVAIFHLPGGEFHATSNVCTHEYALLSDGWLENGCIECPLHAAQFDCRTGKALSTPADEDLKVFEVKVEGDDLFVKA